MSWWRLSEEVDHAQPEVGVGAATPALGEGHHHPLPQQSAPPAGSPASNAGTAASMGTPSLGARPRTTPRSRPNSKQPLSPPKPENRLRGRGARMRQLMLQPLPTRIPTPPGVTPHRETSREGLRSVPPSPSDHGFLDGPLCLLCDHSTCIPASPSRNLQYPYYPPHYIHQ